MPARLVPSYVHVSGRLSSFSWRQSRRQHQHLQRVHARVARVTVTYASSAAEWCPAGVPSAPASQLYHGIDAGLLGSHKRRSPCPNAHHPSLYRVKYYTALQKERRRCQKKHAGICAAGSLPGEHFFPVSEYGPAAGRHRGE